MKASISAVGAALALVVTLAACGTGSVDTGSAQTSQPPVSGTEDSAPGASGTPAHNHADTDFAQMMIVHHQGAIEMGEIATKQATTKEVRTLAHQISDGQDPEIEKMTAWLVAWGEDTVLTSDEGIREDHGGIEHAELLMEDLNQQEALSDLEARSGADFDKRFLELMTAHHQGAVQMAQAQLDQGQNLYALDLAQQIIVDQEAEIERMTQLAESLLDEKSSSWL